MGGGSIESTASLVGELARSRRMQRRGNGLTATLMKAATRATTPGAKTGRSSSIYTPNKEGERAHLNTHFPPTFCFHLLARLPGMGRFGLSAPTCFALTDRDLARLGASTSCVFMPWHALLKTTQFSRLLSPPCSQVIRWSYSISPG